MTSLAAKEMGQSCHTEVTLSPLFSNEPQLIQVEMVITWKVQTKIALGSSLSHQRWSFLKLFMRMALLFPSITIISVSRSETQI